MLSLENDLDKDGHTALPGDASTVADAGVEDASWSEVVVEDVDVDVDVYIATHTTLPGNASTVVDADVKDASGSEVVTEYLVVEDVDVDIATHNEDTDVEDASETDVEDASQSEVVVLVVEDVSWNENVWC
jgi:hypothetical protein